MKFWKDEKGQVGIGTLIVFIAMVLVAAIAATVLINTAGLLQERAQTTGSEATQQTSTGLNVVSAYGDVNETAGDKVTDVYLTVKLRAGSLNIDMEKTVIQYIDDDTSAELTYGSSADNDNFAVSATQDSDSSLPVLNDQKDVFVIALDLADIRAGSASAAETNGLGESETATVKIVPPTGATTVFTFTIPNSVDGYTVVDLG